MLAIFAVLFLLPAFSVANEGNLYGKETGERSIISYSVIHGSNLSLKGTTNINSFECASNSEDVNGYILADEFSDDNRVYFNDADMVVNVSSFDCKNPMITRDLHKALGGADNSEIEIRLLNAITTGTNWFSKEGKLIAKILITINGVSREKEMKVGWDREQGFEYRFKGMAELYMSDFGIEPPSPAMGLVKVHDRITINFSYNVQPGIISRMD